jgi:hypothetical protein
VNDTLKFYGPTYDMRFDLTTAPPPGDSFGARPPHRRVALAMCVVVHLLLVYLYMQTSPAPAARAQTDPPGTLLVWLSPRVAPLQPAPPVRRATRSDAVLRKKPAFAGTNANASTPIPIAKADSTAVVTIPLAAAPTSSESATPANGTFDMQAALDMARMAATEKSTPMPHTRSVPMSAARIESESTLGKAIAGTRRRNCNDGVPGGLLAPLLLLSDKKDSGCKW